MPSIGCALGLQYLLDVSPNFLVIDELATLRSCDASFDSSAEASVFFDQAQDSFLYKPLNVRTGITGDLRQQRFLLGCETDFQGCQCKSGSPCCQRQQTCDKGLKDRSPFETLPSTRTVDRMLD